MNTRYRIRWDHLADEPVAIVTVTADEAQFIAELIPTDDAAHREWREITAAIEADRIAEEAQA